MTSRTYRTMLQILNARLNLPHGLFHVKHALQPIWKLESSGRYGILNRKGQGKGNSQLVTWYSLILNQKSILPPYASPCLLIVVLNLLLTAVAKIPNISTCPEWMQNIPLDVTPSTHTSPTPSVHVPFIIGPRESHISRAWPASCKPTDWSRGTEHETRTHNTPIWLVPSYNTHPTRPVPAHS